MSTHHYSSLDLARRLLRDIPYPDRARKADVAYDADRAAEYASTCHQWVKELKEMQ